jgi:NADPH:quinone reductase-like Zn-dependent oxidoreductase
MADVSSLQLRSLVTKGGELQLSLARVNVGEPAADEVLVRVEATPINPSDLGLLIGPADMKAARVTGSGEQTTVSAPSEMKVQAPSSIPDRRLRRRH